MGQTVSSTSEFCCSLLCDGWKVLFFFYPFFFFFCVAIVLCDMEKCSHVQPPWSLESSASSSVFYFLIGPCTIRETVENNQGWALRGNLPTKKKKKKKKTEQNRTWHIGNGVGQLKALYSVCDWIVQISDMGKIGFKIPFKGEQEHLPSSSQKQKSWTILENNSFFWSPKLKYKSRIETDSFIYQKINVRWVNHQWNWILEKLLKSSRILFSYFCLNSDLMPLIS